MTDTVCAVRSQVPRDAQAFLDDAPLGVVLLLLSMERQECASGLSLLRSGPYHLADQQRAKQQQHLLRGVV